MKVLVGSRGQLVQALRIPVNKRNARRSLDDPVLVRHRVVAGLDNPLDDAQLRTQYRITRPDLFFTRSRLAPVNCTHATLYFFDI